MKLLRTYARLPNSRPRCGQNHEYQSTFRVPGFYSRDFILKMALPGTPEPKIIVVPGSSLPNQALHLTINTSFKNKHVPAFPPSWERLPEDPRTGAAKLAEELGLDGVIAVVLLVDRPIACAGALPYRGDNWVEAAKSADGDNQIPNEEITTQDTEVVPKHTVLPNASRAQDWELCCVCVHPLHRRTGLSVRMLEAISDAVRGQGAKRLFSTYVTEETGMYWPHLGFETVPGAGGVLKKGFTHTKGMPGLREDIHFATG